MRVARQRSGCDAAAVRERLRPESWPTWLSNARPSAAGRVDLAFDGPRPFRVAVQVNSAGTGCDVALLEGDLSALSATFVVSDAGDVHFTADIGFPIAIPTALVHEVGAWLDARLDALTAT